MSSSYLRFSIQKAGGNPRGTELDDVIAFVHSIVTGLRIGTKFVPIQLQTASIQSATTYAQLTAAINAAIDATLFGADLQATLLSDGFTISIADVKGREFADDYAEVPGAGITVFQNANSATSSTFTSVPPATPTSYSVRAVGASVSEGSPATFELSTVNIPAGTTFNYSLSGVAAADITGGSISGTVKTLANGKATITVPIALDDLTEGNETLTLTVEGESAAVSILDTSSTRAPTYYLSPLDNVDEGVGIDFGLGTTGLAAGSLVPYTFSGISESDLFGGSLSGYVAVDSAGQAWIFIGILADYLTEGQEVLTLTVPETSISVRINDTSRGLAVVNGLTVGDTVVFVPTDQAEQVTGRSSMDIVQYPNEITAYAWSHPGDDDWSFFSQLVSSDIDHLSGIERVQFTDQTMALDLDGNAGTAVRLLGTLFGPNTNPYYNLRGLVISLLDAGWSKSDLARAGLNAMGISTLEQLTTIVWGNVTGTSAGPSEFALVQNLVAGGMNFEDIVLLAAGSDTLAAAIDMAAMQTTGIRYAPYVPPPPPTYAVTASGAAVNEGSVATFNVVTGNVASGTALDYTITGVTAADIGDGRLTGQVIVDGNGKASLQIPIAADQLSEGLETLVVNLAGASASMRIDDTSLTPVVPGYSLAATTAMVNEGAGARFVLTTQNVAAGTVLNYHISGSRIDASDLFGGQLGGQVVVDQTGRGVIEIGIRADEFTEGSEVLQLAVESASASLLINDTSLTPVVPGYSLAATTAAINEGASARFVLTTQNVAAGTVLNYHISGSHIDAADLFGGQLGGQVVVDQTGRGVIEIGIRADEFTEGSEVLQLVVESASASLLINDTSTTLVGVPDPGGDGGDGGGGGGGG